MKPEPTSATKPGATTAIQRLYVEWREATSRYLEHDAKWRAGLVSVDDSEKATGPIYDEMNALEDRIFAQACSGFDDLRILIEIAAFYDWNVEHYNEGVAQQSEALFFKAHGPSAPAPFKSETKRAAA